jgi:hypothetical protein
MDAEVVPSSGVALAGAAETSSDESRDPGGDPHSLPFGFATCASSAAILAATLLLASSVHPDATWAFEYFPNTRLEGDSVHAAIATPDFEIAADFAPATAEHSLRIAESRKVESDFPRGLPDREGFSVRMHSCIEIGTHGVYRIAAHADDAVRFFVDDQLQIDASGQQAMEGVVKALQLGPGLHSLLIEYMNTKGSARLAISMSGTDPFHPARSLQEHRTRMGRGLKCAAQ